MQDIQQSPPNSNLSTIINDNEEWLMARILNYAHQHNYTQYTSTLVCAWRVSIAGLSEAITDSLIQSNQEVIEFDSDDTFTDNPVARFAVSEAMLHRKRGISLGMFLGLLKYYRQTYVDLVEEQFVNHTSLAQSRQLIHRCFDLFEIALTTEWTSTSTDRVVEELQAANREMTNEKNFYLTAYESLQHPAILLDESFHIIAVNMAAINFVSGKSVPAGENYYRRRISNFRPMEEKLPVNLPNIDPVGDHIFTYIPSLENVLTHRSLEDGPMNEEISIIQADHQYEMLLSHSLMQDVSGKYSGSIVFLTDISDRKEMEDELRELTEHDPLTGAGNRRYLQKAAESEITRANRYASSLCAIAIDLDKFKLVNDLHGHGIGDYVLVQFAQKCTDMTRENDIFVRMGGEEFLLLLPNTNLNEAIELAERIRAKISMGSHGTHEMGINITASFGVAELDRHNKTVSTQLELLIESADKALYLAKQSGRDCVKFVPPARN